MHIKPLASFARGFIIYKDWSNDATNATVEPMTMACVPNSSM